MNIKANFPESYNSKNIIILLICIYHALTKTQIIQKSIFGLFTNDFPFKLQNMLIVSWLFSTCHAAPQFSRKLTFNH